MTLTLDHVGIVVEDLDAAIDWYSNALDTRVVWQQPPHDVPAAALGLPSGGAVRLSAAMLDGGPARGIELHQYHSPETIAAARSRHYTGLGHLALAVADIHAAQARLTKLGVVFAAGPQRILSGPLAGRQWVYGVDPFGVVLELCQHANP
jgi:lactoylglutathione lyase/glyoxylase I family protein